MEHKFCIALCGPSGVGKGTITEIILKDRSHLFQKRVSHTSRKPRTGEIEGKHYYFSTKEEIESKMDRGEMIEISMVHNNLYGTSFDSVNHVIGLGKYCIIEIDIGGAQTIKKSGKLLNCVYIFIKPPNLEELEKRLTGRGTESEDQINIRLETARNELKFIEENESFFDRVFINHDANDTAEALVNFCLNHFGEI